MNEPIQEPESSSAGNELAPRTRRPSASAVRRRRLRRAMGVLVWAVLLGGGATLLEQPEKQRGLGNLAPVVEWFAGRRQTIVLEFPRPVAVHIGDPVLFGGGEGDFTLVGQVRELLEGDEVLARHSALVRRVRCELVTLDEPGFNSAASATLVSVPQTAAWVLGTLLPPERLAWIAREWNATLVAHREEIFDTISPVLRGVTADLQEIALHDLPDALARRRDRLGALGERYQEEIVASEFRPLLEEELWPILRRRAQPTLDAVGQEILERVPVWGLTWRLVYETLPLTRDDVVEEAWKQFVEEEVEPILKDHIDDFLAVSRDVIAEASRNEVVAASFRRVFRKVLNDPALQHEARLIFQEVILDNPRFHEAMMRHWRSEEMREAIERLTKYLAPFFTRVSDAVLGTRGGGITPEFARVLRTQILQKDRRWIWMEPGPAGAPPIARDQLLRAELRRDV